MAHDTNRVLVEVEGATKHYPGVRALTDATVRIAAGEVRALLGRNGAGKSTLIRLLSGVEQADEGRITIGGDGLGSGGVRRAGELGVETVHQELSLVPTMTVAENLYLGNWARRGGRIDYAHMSREATRVLGELHLSISPDALVEELPIAEQQLVEIARAVRTEPRLLILDEPTSALAASEVGTVLETVRRIAERGVAVIYVSHRLDEIRQVASSATVMRDGRVIETVDLADTTTAEVVALMLGEANDSPTERVVRDVDRGGRPVLRAERIAVAPKLVEATFDLHEGEILGLAGLMGSGRSELLRAIAGFEKAASGTVCIDDVDVPLGRPRAMKKLGVGMTPEDRKSGAIVPLLGVDENLVLSDFHSVSAGPTIQWRRLRDAARTLIERLSIATSDEETPIVNLSGGNQQKAVIGRWLHAGSRILLLDEPTRGVDVKAKEEIYRLVRELADHGAAIIFVSGELEELASVCDRVLVLRNGVLEDELIGEQITTDSVIAAAMATETA